MLKYTSQTLEHFHFIVFFSEYVLQPFTLLNTEDKGDLASLVMNKWHPWWTWKGLLWIPIDLFCCASWV